MNETQWKAKLVASGRLIGAKVLSLHGHGMQAPGWPDIWVGSGIWTGWIELKMHDTEIQTNQKLVMKELEKLGASVIVRMEQGERMCVVERVTPGRLSFVRSMEPLSLKSVLEAVSDATAGYDR